MSSSALAQLQADFIAYLHHGARAPGILSQVNPPSGLTPVAVMDQYRDAYYVRLQGLLGQHCPALKHWMGERAFNRVARLYFAAYPPRHFSIRALGCHWPAFLARTFPAQPAYGQMAALEYIYWDLIHQAKEEGSVQMQQYLQSGLSPENWVFHLASSVRIYTRSDNLLPIWEAALHTQSGADGRLPTYHTMPAPVRYLLWQKAAVPYYQQLTAPLFFMLHAIAAGENLSALSLGVAPWWAQTTIAQQVMGCLQAWMQAGVLINVAVT